MGGIFGVVVLFALVLPVVSIVMLANLGSRISDVENSIEKLKSLVENGAKRALTQEAPPYSQPIDARPPPPIPAMEPAPVQAAPVPVTPPPITATPEVIAPASVERAPRPEEGAPDGTPEPEQTAEDLISSEAYGPKSGPPESFAAKDANDGPSWIGSRLHAFKSWLLDEGNIWATIGVLLFLAGFGLLFSYAAQMNWISLETRLMMAAATGAAMTAFGWRMRARRRVYALILQGGGVGVMYIAIFASAKLGPVISQPAAIVGMLALSAFTVIAALAQDYEPLAIFALLGGYSAPILVSTGSSNFVALFSIHSLLNLEILFITFRRDWRKTRWGGVSASIATAVLWGLLRWRDSYLASVEPFLVLFFVNYSAVAFVPLLRGRAAALRSTSARHRVDTPLAAFLPFAFLSLQMAAAGHTRYGIAIACMALGAWYLGAALYCMKGARPGQGEINPRLFLAYCIIFSNLAIPFIFRKAASSCIWAIEGTFILAYAARCGKRAANAFGGLLHIFALLLYVAGPHLRLPGHLYENSVRLVGFLGWRNDNPQFFLTGMIFAASALAASYFMALQTPPRAAPSLKEEAPSAYTCVSWVFSAYGTLWLTLAAYHEFFAFRSSFVTAFSALCVCGAAGYVLSRSARRGTLCAFGCKSARWAQSRLMALPPIAIACAHAFAPSLGREFAGMMRAETWLNDSILNWLAFAAMYAASVMHYRDERGKSGPVEWAFVIFAFVSYTSRSLAAWTPEFAKTPPRMGDIGYLLSFLPVFAASAKLAARRPLSLLPDGYKRATLAAVAALMLFKLRPFGQCFGELGEWMRHYVPIFNTLELWQLLYMASAGFVLHAAGRARWGKAGIKFALPAVAFIWLHSVAARASWHYFEERVGFGFFTHAPHFQAIIAILWGLAAILLIFGGKKFENRYPWFLGAGLLACDILKLLTIDLRNSATVIRIFAFLALGGFFLFIGWSTPLPPKAKTDGHA
ncbi:MAG: DUF2339 domain-containing protein [Synergistaceae bacterium]|jgi:uncharacterized membrane protein|nr:DUF2339 domain-containing protein [Synergistaceae bacterium]